jgi:hypothetical protein
MGSMSGIVKQLKKERDLVAKQLEGLNAALSAFVGVYTGAKSVPAGKRRKMSAATRAKIAAAQRKRWANANKRVKTKAGKKKEA